MKSLVKSDNNGIVVLNEFIGAIPNGSIFTINSCGTHMTKTNARHSSIYTIKDVLKVIIFQKI